MALDKVLNTNRSQLTTEDALFVKSGDINPVIDRVNSISSADGYLTVEDGSESSPSIVASGAAGVFITATTAGLTTAGTHALTLTGAGRAMVTSSSTTGGFGIDTTTGLVPVIICGATDNIAAATGGAISVANYCTTINTDAGGDAFTLADGVVPGQLKRILFVVDGGGDGVVTSKFAGAATTLTFSDAGEFATLMWDGTDWIALELGSVITITHTPVIA